MVSHFVGADPARWRRGIPSFQEVVYHDLWPGVDAVFRNDRHHLKYEFIVRPGARVEDIRLTYEGASAVSLEPGGGLLIRAPSALVHDSPPISFQPIDGRRVAVPSRFDLARGGTYSFRLDAPYDHSHPLVIDPGLEYSTYLGGEELTEGRGIVVDREGHAYVTGLSSFGFPTTPGAFDTSSSGGDAFVAKLDRNGTRLVYATFLGGSGFDEGIALALDDQGEVVVTGDTQSLDFPTTPGAFDTTYNGDSDVFVAKLDRTGSALVYSTLLGGTAGELGVAVALDQLRRAYVTGATQSTGFPSTPGALDRTFNGGFGDAFIAKIDPTGSTLLYATLLGGSEGDEGRGIAIDEEGQVFLAGQTGSSDFPTTSGAFDRTLGGMVDAFVVKLTRNGSSLVYGTYLGGRDVDLSAPQQALAVDQQGHAFVTGSTLSRDFPTTRGAFATRLNGPSDAYVTELDLRGSGLVYSTLLGGTGFDDGRAITVDLNGRAHLTGVTDSPDFPTTPDAVDRTLHGVHDAFVTTVNAAGTRVRHSTFLGGAEDVTLEMQGELGSGIAVDRTGGIYVVGDTDAADFPTTRRRVRHEPYRIPRRIRDQAGPGPRRWG